MSKKKPKFETIGDVVRKTRVDKPKADAPAPVAAQPKKGKTAKKAKQDDSALSVVSPSPAVQPQSNEALAAPTLTVAKELQYAFDHFNAALFNGSLPPVMMRLERLKKYKGYFRRDEYAALNGEAKTAEIVLDPSLIRTRTLEDTLSTLVHEMVHLQDFANGTAPKKAYHGKSGVALMNAIDLTPFILDAKGVPTGKETGPNSSHTVVEGGKFAVACKSLLASGFVLTWNTLPVVEVEKDKKKKKGGAKAKHSCPECQANAWGAPSLKLMCGECSDEETPVRMVCEDGYEGDDQ